MDIRTIFLWFFGVGSICAAAWQIRKCLLALKEEKASEFWTGVEGTVTDTEIVRETGGGGVGQSRTVWVARIKYAFEYDGRTFHGDRIAIGGVWSSTKGMAEDRLRRYPEGKTVTVWFDPDDPATCCLERSGGATPGLLAIAGVFLVIGTVVIYKQLTG